MVSKPFDRALFEQNDAAARAVVLTHLASEGFYPEPNSDRYGIDLVFSEAGQVYYGIEVEVKHTWSISHPKCTGNIPGFKWDTVQLPARKAKFSQLPYPTEYWILNRELTHALVIPDYTLTGLIPVIVRNKYVPDGEAFYKIPLEQCNIVELLR